MRMRTTQPRPGWTRLDNEVVTRGIWATLTDIECRVYVGLLVHINERRECWPSLKTLGRETGRHWTAISGAVHQLAKRGLTTIRNASGKSNVYYIRTWTEIAQALREGKSLSATAKPTFSAGANRSRYIEVDPKEADTAYRRQKPTRGTSPSSTPGSGHRETAPLPAGFVEWVRHLNEALGLRSPKVYTPGSLTGRRLAAQYANLRSRFSEADLLRVVDIAAAKAARGFKAAAWPNFMLSRVEEFLAEAESRPGGHGRAPVFRSGEDHEKHLEAMRRVVER